MNKIILITIGLLSQLLWAQAPTPFDKIIMEYNYELESGRRKGVFYKAEIVAIVVAQDGKYYLEKNSQTTRKFDGSNRKTRTIELQKRRIINNEICTALFVEMNTNKDNFTSEYLKPKLERPKKKAIKKCLKDKLAFLKFEKKRLNKKLQREIRKEVLQLTNFDEFIADEKPKPNELYGMVDGRVSLTIKFIQKKDTLHYTAATFHQCGQPIHNLKSTSEKLKIVNLDVNKIIQKIVPKKSYINKEFELNTITEKYIRWYIDAKL